VPPIHTAACIAGVLTGLTLTLGGAAFAAPAAHADIPACTNMVKQTGVEVSDAVRMACNQGVHGDLRGCVSALTQAGTPGGAANGACRMAANPPWRPLPAYATAGVAGGAGGTECYGGHCPRRS
jgi:hypothetical protein